MGTSIPTRLHKQGMAKSVISPKAPIGLALSRVSLGEGHRQPFVESPIGAGITGRSHVELAPLLCLPLSIPVGVC